MLKNRVSLWKPSPPIPERIGIRGPHSCAPRRQPLPPPSEAGEGICSSEEGSGVRTVLSHREDRYPIPVAPGVPLGWRATSHLCGRKRCAGRHCCFCCCVMMRKRPRPTGGAEVSCFLFICLMVVIRPQMQLGIQGVWSEGRKLGDPRSSFSLVSANCFMPDMFEGVKR